MLCFAMFLQHTYQVTQSTDSFHEAQKRRDLCNSSRLLCKLRYHLSHKPMMLIASTTVGKLRCFLKT